MPYILVLGASSDIAKATGVKFAVNGFDLYLAGRNVNELEKDAADIKIRHSVSAQAIFFDATA
ncbi:short-chain dehydrogenase, partial [bacterium]|nr:short-chain dehydrogenase [bacterium]